MLHIKEIIKIYNHNTDTTVIYFGGRVPFFCYTDKMNFLNIYMKSFYLGGVAKVCCSAHVKVQFCVGTICFAWVLSVSSNAREGFYSHVTHSPPNKSTRSWSDSQLWATASGARSSRVVCLCFWSCRTPAVTDILWLLDYLVLVQPFSEGMTNYVFLTASEKVSGNSVFLISKQLIFTL